MTLGQNSPGKDLKVRYLYLGGIMLLGLLVLAGRLYRLQITRGEEFVAKSVENFVKQIRIPADRGMILDTNGRILVDSRPSFDVFVTPAFCVKCKDEVLPQLSEYLEWTPQQRADVEYRITRARRDAPFRPIPVKIDVERELADFLDAHRLELPGVDVLANPHRNYRTGTVLSHVLGYMNEITQEELDRLNKSGGHYLLGDYIGRRGIEKAFEKNLRGKDGERKQVVDARGQPIPGLSELVGGARITEPTAGNNVVLSIDMRLQEEADRAFPGKAGAIIMVEVKTGFVRALVSRPGYDPNLLTGRINSNQLGLMSMDEFKPLMNRVTQMHYAPGSTFKIVTGLAALRDKVFTPHTHVNCPGGYRLGSRVWRCWRDAGHGLKDARTALQQSCDTYYYRAADLLGIEPIAREAREFGFGSPTGITGLLEVPGIVPDTAYHDRVTPGGYQKGMALNTSIGQGDVTVTPVQLVMAFAALANGGTLHRPQLVKRIESPRGEVVKSFEPEVIRSVDLPKEHRDVIVQGLDMVVNEPGGTSYGKRLKTVRVAGKTGTAQVAKLGAKRLKKEEIDYWLRDHAWFAAFAPVDDPEVAIVVLNEHGGGGSSDAAPTAMAVLQKYFDLKAEAAAGAENLANGLVPADGWVPTNVETPARTAPDAAAPQREPANAPAPAPSNAPSAANLTAPAPANAPAPMAAPSPAKAPAQAAPRVATPPAPAQDTPASPPAPAPVPIAAPRAPSVVTPPAAASSAVVPVTKEPAAPATAQTPAAAPVPALVPKKTPAPAASPTSATPAPANVPATTPVPKPASAPAESSAAPPSAAPVVTPTPPPATGAAPSATRSPAAADAAPTAPVAAPKPKLKPAAIDAGVTAPATEEMR